MTPAQYRKARAGDRVRSLCAFGNAYAELPAGTLFTVRGKRSGFDLQADPCDCCGVALRIHKVLPSDVEVVE